MNEQQVAAVAKWLQDNSNRRLTFVEKEMLKSMIDSSFTVGDLIRNLSSLANMG